MRSQVTSTLPPTRRGIDIYPQRRLVTVPLSSIRRVPVTTLTPLNCKPPALLSGRKETMPAAKAHASTILAEFEKAQAELVGRAVVLTDGKAGTVENLWLDELHGIRLSIRGHDGKWPVATVKFVAAPSPHR